MQAVGLVGWLSVFMSPELTTEARISEQGLVNFPLIGSIKIAGLSIAQAEAELSRLLKAGGYISKAQVLMTVTAYRSQLVSVLGNVVKPGPYPLEMPGLRLSELLAQLGGIAPVDRNLSWFPAKPVVGRSNILTSTYEVSISMAKLNSISRCKLGIRCMPGGKP